MPRRRKADATGAFFVILILAAGFVLFAVVRSPFGYVIAAVSAIGGPVLGAWIARDETARRQRWRDRARLRDMTGVEFERHVAELYRRMGYATELTKASGGRQRHAQDR